MPRDGSGVASQPAGTAAVSNATISSTKFNSIISDIYALFNSGLNPESVDLNGGTIDGVTIGGSVPAPASFTTLLATGNFTLGDNVFDITSVAGALVIDIDSANSTSASKLIVKIDGANRCQVDENGAVTATGDITAFGGIS